MNDEAIERYVAKYGERYRRLITDALSCLNARTFIIGEEFNEDEYIAKLIERAK